jgi:hypothetical protein
MRTVVPSRFFFTFPPELSIKSVADGEVKRMMISLWREERRPNDVT